MPPVSLRCIKSGTVFPFSLDRFNNPAENSPHYANLVAEWGYTNRWYLSQTPFQKVHFSYGAKNTPLREVPGLAQELWISHLMIKDESFNPYGTHKDRRSEYIVNIALEHGVDKIVCLTAGNAGYSLSRYCARVGIDYTSMIFPRVSPERQKTLREWGNVMVLDSHRKNGILRPRDFVWLVKEFDYNERGKKRNKIRAVTNSFEPLSVLAYKELFYEVAEYNPDYIVVPCGSGDVIIGIRLAIQELWAHTKIIWVWPANEHPLQYALQYGLDEYEIPHLEEKSLADKLRSTFTSVLPILWHIFHHTTGNTYISVWNTLLVDSMQCLSKHGVRAEHSSAVIAWPLLSKVYHNMFYASKTILVNTWNGIVN